MAGWMVAVRGDTERELDEALDADGVAGAVLLGAAGVGKTALARIAVTRWRARHGGSALVHWVSATGSAGHIPFGAFSHFIDVTPGRDPVSVLSMARETMCPPGAVVIVVVDDAHLLDGQSAALVHQLATASPARVLITCRTGEPTPDAITALWKDHAVRRLEVEPFTRPETAALAERVLGGPLEPDSAERIFALSQGNPLFLRHLVEGAQQQRTLRQVGSMWQLRGETALTRQLVELIDADLSAMPAEVRQVLDYLAVAEPLPVTVLTALADSHCVEDAECLGAVRIATLGSGLAAYPGHPLYTECRRTAMGHLTARRLRTKVVQTITAIGKPAVGTERMRLMALAIDSDAPPDMPDLLAAGWQALHLGDFALTERFARAALTRLDALSVRLLLSHALCWQGRGRDADAVLDAVDPDGLSEPALLHWVLSKATNQFWMLKEADRATAWLTAMRARFTSTSAHLTIDALNAQFAMNLADLPRCLALAGPVLADERTEDLAVAWAAAAAALASARIGRLDDVDALAARTASVSHPDGVRFNAALGQVQATILRADLDAAEALARHHLGLSEFRQPAHAQGQVLLGHVLLVKGDLPAATTLFTAASAHYADTGNAWEALNLSWLATTLGQRGDADGAAEALANAERTHDARTSIHLPELRAARVWTLAAARDMSGALAAARAAISEATRGGQLAQALHAHHDAIRLGHTRSVADLARLVHEIDCPLGPVVLAHGRALTAGDGAHLERVAEQLAALGMRCAAADAAAQAASVHAARQHRAAELDARSTAARLRRECGAPMTPALEAALHPLPLTGREREIALLVAAGRTNRAIAEQLGLSVRTVETHVLRACTKLDVSNRVQLAHAVHAAIDP